MWKSTPPWQDIPESVKAKSGESRLAYNVTGVVRHYTWFVITRETNGMLYKDSVYKGYAIGRVDVETDRYGNVIAARIFISNRTYSIASNDRWGAQEIEWMLMPE